MKALKDSVENLTLRRFLSRSLLFQLTASVEVQQSETGIHGWLEIKFLGPKLSWITENIVAFGVFQPVTFVRLDFRMPVFQGMTGTITVFSEEIWEESFTVWIVANKFSPNSEIFN